MVSKPHKAVSGFFLPRGTVCSVLFLHRWELAFEFVFQLSVSLNENLEPEGELQQHIAQPVLINSLQSNLCKGPQIVSLHILQFPMIGNKGGSRQANSHPSQRHRRTRTRSPKENP